MKLLNLVVFAQKDVKAASIFAKIQLLPHAREKESFTRMTDTKHIKSGSVEMKAPILSRCPHCDKPNPVVEALTMGESTDAVMVGFVPQCCKRIISCMMIAKVPQAPVIN